MKSTALTLLLLTFVPGVVAVAEEYPEFVAGMKIANSASSSLMKMEKKTGPQAVRAAERLGVVYEELIPFFRQWEAADAVKLAEEGKAAAAQLAAAAFAGDESKAEAALQSVGGTCKSCHAARREKLADGKFRIK